MKVKEKRQKIREKAAEDCLKLLAEKAKRLSDIRFASASSKEKNTKEASGLKKDIARIKTILKEKKENE